MKGNEGLQTVDQTLVDEFHRTTRKRFFGGLEEDPHPGPELEAIQNRGDAEGNGGVGVVPAGVHPIRSVRHRIIPFRLPDGQSVEVCPEPDCRAFSDVDPEPGSRSPQLVGDPVRRQGFRDQHAGLMLFVSSFGMTMKLSPKLDGQGCDLAG
jgi:hypothetical protein